MHEALANPHDAKVAILAVDSAAQLVESFRKKIKNSDIYIYFKKKDGTWQSQLTLEIQ
ncbi:MAG: hypothetical protein ACI9IA_002420 [Enterobacterales bacterium]